MNRAALALSLASLLVACSGEFVEEVDLSHPTVPDDAASADVDPLLPENDGADAAPADEDANVDADAPSDARTTDGAAAADAAGPAADTPPPPPPPPPPAPRCTGSASGQSSIWTCTADRRARQRCVAGVVQTEPCAHGCTPQPSGTHDFCAPAPAPGGLPACARQALLSWGLHPTASDHLRCAGITASRITQTIGNAVASAGTHGRDGYASGQPYSAATDLSVRGLSQAEIRALLGRLGDHGFAAWYRWPGHDGWPASEAPHIHAIFVGCAMKASLRAQVGDWLVGRNGLTSHSAYTFYTWSAAQRATVRALFQRFN